MEKTAKQCSTLIANSKITILSERCRSGKADTQGTSEARITKDDTDNLEKRITKAPGKGKLGMAKRLETGELKITEALETVDLKITEVPDTANSGIADKMDLSQPELFEILGTDDVRLTKVPKSAEPKTIEAPIESINFNLITGNEGTSKGDLDPLVRKIPLNLTIKFSSTTKRIYVSSSLHSKGHFQDEYFDKSCKERCKVIEVNRSHDDSLAHSYGEKCKDSDIKPSNDQSWVNLDTNDTRSLIGNFVKKGFKKFLSLIGMQKTLRTTQENDSLNSKITQSAIDNESDDTILRKRVLNDTSMTLDKNCKSEGKEEKKQCITNISGKLENKESDLSLEGVSNGFQSSIATDGIKFEQRISRDPKRLLPPSEIEKGVLNEMDQNVADAFWSNDEKASEFHKSDTIQFLCDACNVM